MKLPIWIERFRKHTNGERVRVEEGLNEIENGYFRKIGQYFKTAQILLYLLLFLFVTVFALTNSESITYQNLYYFLRDFRTAVDNTDAAGEGIAYEVDDNASFTVFKGGLAVAGRSRLQILTAAGGMNLSAAVQFSEPLMSASKKLLLIYGQGETTCHIYNSFTRIHSEEIGGKIHSAYLSEAGAYSVTAEDEEYASAVYVFSRNFQKLNKYNLNSYAISAPISKDGKAVAILSYTMHDGVYETRLRLAEVGTDRVYCDYTVNGDFPLGVSFTGNDRVLLLTQQGLHAVTKKNGGTLVEDFDDRTVGAFSLDDTGVSLLFNDNDSLQIYDSDGNVQRSYDVPDSVRTVRKYGDYTFYQTDTEIVRVSADGMRESLDCHVYGGELLVVSEDTLLLCHAGEAKYYCFGK